MEGANESTELRRHPKFTTNFIASKLTMLNNTTPNCKKRCFVKNRKLVETQFLQLPCLVKITVPVTNAKYNLIFSPRLDLDLDLRTCLPVYLPTYLFDSR